MIHVLPPDAARLWPAIEGYVREANEYTGGKMLAHDWLAQVLLGQADLFISADQTLMAIGEPRQFPRKLVYLIALVAGKHNGAHNWADVMDTLRAAARARGCTQIEAYGRPGWGPILGELGFRQAHVVWRSEV